MLAIEYVVSEGATPLAFMFLTHGIYGSGGNWRTVARRLVSARPEWGIALIDLRGHGRSPKGDPPHTIAACADDVIAAMAAPPAPVRALSGHSFGGKVMLAVRAALRQPRLQTWLLDSSPSARTNLLEQSTNTVVTVLSVIEAGPLTWPSRPALVDALAAQGVPPTVGQWFAMNLVPKETGYTLRLDPPQLRSLLEDYYRRDAWPEVTSPDLGELRAVIALQSTTLGESDRARFSTLAADPATHVHVHLLDTGHWVNAEAPDALVELWRLHLPQL